MDPWGYLGQVLECSVCLETLDATSRVLPCQHTFCRSCLIDIINTHKELRCPECRVLVTVPFEMLPTNILLIRILEGMKIVDPSQISPIVTSTYNTQELNKSIHVKSSSNFCNTFSPSNPFSPLSSTNNTPFDFGVSSSYVSPEDNLENISTSIFDPLSQECISSNNELDRRFNMVSSVNTPLGTSSNQIFNETSSLRNLPISSTCASTLDESLAVSAGSSNLSRTNSVVSSYSSHSSTVNPECLSRSLSSISSALLGTSPLNIQAKALYNYDKRESRDLSFKKGNLIRILSKIDDNWYQGELDGQIGCFPVSYVKVLDTAPNNVPQCRALYDFKMNSGDERDCLAFVKGETLTVLRRIDTNWAEGKLNTRIGIFPLSFVELNPAARGLLNITVSQQPVTSRIPVTTELDRTSSSATLVPNVPIPPISTLSVETVVTSSPCISLSSLQSAPNDLFTSSVLSPTPSTTNPIPSSTIEGEGERKNSFSDFHTLSGTTIPGFSLSSSDSNDPFHIDVQESQAQSASSSSTLNKSNTDKKEGLMGISMSTIVRLQVYIALFAYRPRKADELELTKGELYSVSEKCQDGWFKGRSLISDKIGVFPGNYVQLAKSENVGTFLSNCTTSQARNLLISPSRNVASVAKDQNVVSYSKPKSPQIPNTGSIHPVAIPPELPPRSRQSPVVLTHSEGNLSYRNSPCPSPVPSQGEKDRKISTLGLMRKLTISKKKCKSPPLLSMENPIFEDSLSKKICLFGGEFSKPHCDETEPSTKSMQPAPLVKERFRCIVPYPPNSPYELELKIGDLVYVHRKRDDGWYKGTLLRTGKTGLFPNSFVEQC